MSSNPKAGFQFLTRLYQAVLAAIFPPRCPGCGRSGMVWCTSCQKQLRLCSGPVCTRCGSRHGPGRCTLEDGSRLAIRSYARYRQPLTRAILELKYRPNRALGRVMAGWLVGCYQKTRWRADIVVPVPLAVARQRQRGYNQVELISSPLAEALDLPHYRNALKRVRDTGSQVGRDFSARRVNVEGAFNADPHFCHQRNILLIDDLVTTGATLRACSQALLQAGGVAIYGLTVGQASR